MTDRNRSAAAERSTNTKPNPIADKAIEALRLRENASPTRSSFPLFADIDRVAVLSNN